jgi:hypothetical protein
VAVKLKHASFYQGYFTNLKQYTPAHLSGKSAVYQYVLFGYEAHAGKLCTEPEVCFLHPYEASINGHQNHALYGLSRGAQRWLDWYNELEQGIEKADRQWDEGEFDAARTAYAWAVKGFESTARRDEGYAHAKERLELIVRALWGLCVMNPQYRSSRVLVRLGLGKVRTKCIAMKVVTSYI